MRRQQSTVMGIIFGYIAGVLTLLNPCILPVLPVVLIGALNQHRFGPLALCAGLSLSLVTLGVLVASLGPALGIDDTTVSKTAAVVMIIFGIVLLVPAMSAKFSVAAAGMSNSLSVQTKRVSDKGLSGQFITGLLLGAVWSPCIGPTLGGAIALASQGSNLAWATAVMLAFALGVSTIILVLATVSREALQTTRQYAEPVLLCSAHYGRAAAYTWLGPVFPISPCLRHLGGSKSSLLLQDLSVKF